MMAGEGTVYRIELAERVLMIFSPAGKRHLANPVIGIRGIAPVGVTLQKFPEHPDAFIGPSGTHGLEGRIIGVLLALGEKKRLLAFGGALAGAADCG